MLTKTCQYCHREFLPINERPSHPAKYCSRKCRDLARTTRVTLTCRQCGKPFQRKAYMKDWSQERGPFCGFVCYGKWQQIHLAGKGQKRIAVTCYACGKPLERIPSIVQGQEHHFCDRACLGKWRSSDDWRGANNPAWLGGDTNCYRGRNWDTQREKAQERDDYTCQHCGNQDDDLSVHHKRPFGLFDNYKEANHLNNLITLCNSCHKKAEALFWREHPKERANMKWPKTSRLICQRCGKEFYARSASHKFCDVCHTHTCQHCGKEFYDKRLDSVKYCSQQCNYAVHRIWPHKCIHCGKKIASGRTRCWKCFMTIDNPRRQYSRKLKAARAAEVQK